MSASFTVFVCSTFSDLSSEREGVLDAIRRLKLQHDSMEFFGARAGQPIETCLQEVRASDVLVVIVGHRYGSIVPELGISYSEAEYAEGIRLEKPCLVYVRDDDVPILPKHMERDPDKLRLLERWKSSLQSRHTVAMFQDGSRLAVQVTADLSRTIADLEEGGKARAAARPDGDSALHSEINLLLADALGQGVGESSLLSAVRSAVSSLLGTTKRRQPKVFLSYARADALTVRMVAHWLESAGIHSWMDTLTEASPSFFQDMDRELASADIIVLFISPHSMRDEWATGEMRIALHRLVSGEGGAAIFPVLLADTEMPPLLRSIRYIDLRNDAVEAGAGPLVEAILQWPERLPS